MKKTKSKSLKKKKKKKKVGELDEVLNKTDPRGKDIQEVLETQMKRSGENGIDV